MAMEYIKKSRSDEHGNAEIPLYDESSGKVVNRISVVDNDSCLKFLSDKRKSGYTDLSGTVCKMVMTIDMTTTDENGKVVPMLDKDGNIMTESGTSICEILRVKNNDVVVKIDGVAYTVYIGVTKFYKI